MNKNFLELKERVESALNAPDINEQEPLLHSINLSRYKPYDRNNPSSHSYVRAYWRRDARIKKRNQEFLEKMGVK